ncbi:glycosyltransferase family 2 protein [Sphingomonas flavescens]|uniref:glycosyltransferase family 2 protein n=1 Tax=Sphingomonas flavescens TaxID=3132797 RepID=UPI002804A3A8|nr:glycosyltransferase family 2 protein [Sphingomonas limnosediminicola]
MEREAAELHMHSRPALDFAMENFAALDPRKSLKRSWRQPQWTVIIPFFNEQEFIAEALRSVATQYERPELILVDNRSTDRSRAIAEAECERLGLAYVLLDERQPGKVHALRAGLAWVRTPFVATFDADTSYPPNYLESATRLLKHDKCVGAQAYYVRSHWRSTRRFLAAAHLICATWLLPNQCHNGGAGQVFITDVLRHSGGFDADRWNLILEDHEIVHRVSRFGHFRCSRDFWCCPSRRERDLPVLRWSLGERLAYHFTPARFQSKFFYDFLGPRLTARGLLGSAARNRRTS